MLYQVALLPTIGICSWIALDLIFSRTWGRRIASVPILAGAATCWASGESMLMSAATPSEIETARRILFLGVCLIGPAWIWCVLDARRPGWSSARGLRLAALTALPLAIYSTLYWDRSGLFVDRVAPVAQHGPLFFVNAAYVWGLIVAGLVLLLGARQSLAGTWTVRQRGLIALAVLAPIAANGLYLATRFPPFDPTPVLLAGSALIIRHVVLDVIMGAYYLPFARSEVVEQMETGFVVADHDGRIIDSNPAARKLLGRRTLAGHPIREIVSALERRNPPDLEPRGFWLTKHGQTVGMGLSIADRREQRRLEHQSEIATRLEALGHLAAGVSHEINNPLTYLTANLGLLEPLTQHLADTVGDAPPSHANVETNALGHAHERVDERLEKKRESLDLGEELRELALDAPMLLAQCREGADRIRRIVDQLALLSTAESAEERRAEPTRFPLADSVRRARAMALFGQKDARIDLAIEAGATAYAHPPDVVHILLLLFLNAIRAAGPEGRVEVRVAREAGGTSIEVRDDGPGIPEDELPFVFDPLYTTRRPGSLGLGLSRCFRLAGENSGRLDVAGREGGGAVFTLWLPDSCERVASVA